MNFICNWAIFALSFVALQQDFDITPIFKHEKRPHSIFITSKNKEVSYQLQPGVNIVTKAYQNYISITCVNGNSGVELLNIETATRVEVIGHDFNGDGKKELVVAYHTEPAMGEVVIYSAYPEFKKICTLTDLQYEAELEKNKIFLPYGTQGLLTEWIYKNGKFTEATVN